MARLLLPLLIITTTPAPAFAEAEAPPPPKKKPSTTTAGTVKRRSERPSKSQGMRSPRPGDAPGEALLHYHRKRSPDGGPISPSLYESARAKAFKMARYSTALGRQLPSREEDAGQGMAAFLGAWEDLGPNNVGGRTRAFYVGPDGAELYAAGVSGGLFRSTNGGGTWTWTEEETAYGQGTLPNSAISAMIVQPGPPDTIIVGTGEGFFVVDAVQGNGIYTSTDSGSTWKEVPGTKGDSNFQYVNDLVQSTVNTNWFYAATRTGIWRFKDGLFVNLCTTDCSVRGGVTDLVIRNNGGSDELYAAVGMNSPWACGVVPLASDSKVLKIPNAHVGTPTNVEFTFDQLPPGWSRGRISLAYAQSTDTLFALISRRPNVDCVSNPNEWGLYGLYKAQNPGSQTQLTKIVDGTNGDWTTSHLLHNPAYCGSQQVSQGWYDNVIEVEPTGTTLWVGGVSLFRSSSPFTTWGLAMDWNRTPDPNSPYVHEDQHAIRFEGEGTIFVANDGGVFRSDNRSAATAPACPTATPTPTPALQWVARNSGYGTTQFYHGAPFPDGATYFGGTQDNAALKVVAVGTPPPWEVDRIVGGDAGYSVVSGADGWVGGVGPAFGQLGGSRRDAPGAAEDYLFIAPFARDPGHTTRVWAGGRNPYRNPDPRLGNWERATLYGAPDPFWATRASAVGISHNTGSIVAVGREDGTIAWSSNALDPIDYIPPYEGGPTWANGPQPPRSGFISSITMDPGSCSAVATCTAYVTYSTFGVSGESQVYRTDNGGANWTGLATEELQGIPVHTLVVDPDSAMESGRRKTLYIGTDLGVYVSFDRGNTWFKEEAGFPDVPVEALRFNSGSPSYLFAFTHGRGAYRVCHPTGPPVVTAPTPITISQTACNHGASYNSTVNKDQPCMAYQGEYTAEKSKLRAFLDGGSATHSCSNPPARLAPRLGSINGPEIADDTVFPGEPPSNVSTVYFPYQNSQGIGYATSTVTVRRQGDLNQDLSVDIFDQVILAGYIVGNNRPEESPFLAKVHIANTGKVTGTFSDPQYTAPIDIFDLVQHANHIVGNTACLTPVLVLPCPTSDGDGGGTLDATGTATVTATATTTTVPSQGAFSVDVGINVTDVTMTGCSGGQVACVLGGYEIPLQFDKTLIEYVSTTSSPYGAPCGGSRPAQYSLPTVTSASLANANGVMVFTEENGADQTGPTGGPYCYYRINLKAKKVLTDRYTNLWFHRIDNCAIRGGAACDYALSTPRLECSPNPDQEPTNISKNEDIVIPIHIYVP